MLLIKANKDMSKFKMVLCGIHHNFNEASMVAYRYGKSVGMSVLLCCDRFESLLDLSGFFLLLCFIVVVHEKIIHPSTWICGSFFIAGFVRLWLVLLTFTMRSSKHTYTRMHTNTWHRPIFARNIVLCIPYLNMYEICKCVRWFVRLTTRPFFRCFFHFILSDSHFLSIPSLLAIHVR